METSKVKNTLRLVNAYKLCFCDNEGKLTPQGEKVIASLRDICCAKGELGKDGSPYFYDQLGRFDPCAVAFLQGKRSVFDQIMKHLALEERELLNLIAVSRTEESNLIENINI
jgi:hypothetical protein